MGGCTTKGSTDTVRYYYAMARKGFEYISKRDRSTPVESSSLGILKDCANELGISVEGLVDGAYEFKKGKVTRLIAGFTTLENGSANWLCSNKYATFEILKKYGFRQVPNYRRHSLGTINEARQDFLARNKAVVIKPSRQTFGGTGVTVNIRDMKHLNKAIFNSLAYDRHFLMEDFIEGDNFRILCYKDKMLNAVQRIPANVKGDGVNDIGHLIEMENEIRAKDRSHFRLNPIKIDNDVKQTLLNKHMSFDHVPKKDEIVQVRTICNHHAGGETRDVTSIVHPDVVRDCADIMRIMGVTVGGIDIITKDVGKPLDEAGGAVNEVNTSPALDIHDRAVTLNVLSLIFNDGLTS